MAGTPADPFEIQPKLTGAGVFVCPCTGVDYLPATVTGCDTIHAKIHQRSIFRSHAIVINL